MNPFGEVCEKCGSLKTIAIIHNQWRYICPKCDMDGGYVVVNRIDDETAVLDTQYGCCQNRPAKRDFEDAEFYIEEE